jgi:hypothetical protein
MVSSKKKKEVKTKAITKGKKIQKKKGIGDKENFQEILKIIEKYTKVEEVVPIEEYYVTFDDKKIISSYEDYASKGKIGEWFVLIKDIEKRIRIQQRRWEDIKNGGGYLEEGGPPPYMI